MHHKSYHAMIQSVKKISEDGRVFIYPRPLELKHLPVSFILNCDVALRESYEFQQRNGSTIKVCRMFFDTNLGALCVPTAAGRLLEEEITKLKHHGKDPTEYDFQFNRDGEGIATRYTLTKWTPEQRAIDLSKMQARLAGKMAATSSSVDPNYMSPPPAKPTAPSIPNQKVQVSVRPITPVPGPPLLSVRPSWYEDGYDGDLFKPSHVPAVRAVCRCDIKDLLSTGHTKGCPEKKK